MPTTSRRPKAAHVLDTPSTRLHGHARQARRSDIVVRSQPPTGHSRDDRIRTPKRPGADRRRDTRRQARGDLDRIRRELSQYELISEEWGGETLFVSVSAVTGQGVDKLLDSLLLQAELLDLKAADSGPAAGVVLESSLERGRGAVASVLVSKGKLQVGDILLAGQEYGRIRAMFNEAARAFRRGSVHALVVLGLSSTPMAGRRRASRCGIT